MKPVSAQSKTWIRVPIWAEENGLPEDPSGTTVKMAFALAKTDSLVWKTAEWEVNVAVDPDVYYARCLVGPSGGTITLTAGERYYVAVQISGAGVAPEVPVVWANLRLEVEP